MHVDSSVNTTQELFQHYERVWKTRKKDLFELRIIRNERSEKTLSRINTRIQSNVNAPVTENFTRGVKRRLSHIYTVYVFKQTEA